MNEQTAGDRWSHARKSARGRRYRFLAAMILAACAAWQATASLALGPEEDLYSSGHDALDRGRYQEATEIFERVADQASGSDLAGDALYWQAFALQRLGGNENLRQALRVLERQLERYPKAASQGDARELATRIEGALAKRGDPGATQKVIEKAQGETDDEMRLAALDALMHMDGDKAMPLLRRILADPKKNGPEMRKRAVFILSQQSGEEAASILYEVATTDESPEVQGDAVFWLGQTSERQALQALQKILETQRDPHLLKKAVFALSQVGSDEAGRLLEGIVLDAAAPLDVRADAVFWLGQEMRDAKSMMALYPRLDHDALKEKVIFTVAQQGDTAGYDWLLKVANDPSEPAELRKNAFFWVGQEAPIELVVGFYDTSDDRQIREQALFALAQRDEPAAVAKLIDIAMNEADADLRRTAVFWLGQSSDDRALEALQKIIDP